MPSVSCRALFCSLLLLALWVSNPPPLVASPRQAEKSDWRDFTTRWKQNKETLEAIAWTLIHVSESEKEMEEIVHIWEVIESSVNADDPSTMHTVGGIEAVKARFATLMDSPDQVICASAAISLGVLGDREYGPRLAAELHKVPAHSEEELLDPLCRGRTAVALGIMGAEGCAVELLPLLESKNRYDREGAALGLNLLEATSFSTQVAELLPTPERYVTDEEYEYLSDDSAIFSLVRMGLGSQYASQFVEVVQNSRASSEVRTTAMYALARTGDASFAPVIAELLNERFRKGDAAKALALLGATEYSDQIAGLLHDSEPLVLQDAALALGILGADNYAEQVAALLGHELDFVRYYAAVGIIMMQARSFYQEAIPIIDEYHNAGYHMHPGDLHPIMGDKFELTQSRFSELLAAAKSP